MSSGAEKNFFKKMYMFNIYEKIKNKEKQMAAIFKDTSLLNTLSAIRYGLLDYDFR